jgi:phage shock protein PspC (stress-responsive transcriptional regulator)
MSIADEVRKLAELRDSGTLTPLEFERAKARLFGEEGQRAEASSAPAPSEPGQAAPVLRRAGRDRWIGGVCGGLGRYTGLESWVWRVLFTAAVLFAGFGVLPYLILWIFVPVDETI